MPESGKLGRLPLDPERPRLTFEKYLDPRTALAPVPLTADVDRSSSIPSISMYCNDRLGCCTIAAAGHMYGAWSWFGSGGTEAQFSDTEIVRVYSAVSGYDGSEETDNGASMASVLAWLRANDMNDNAGKAHRVLAYAMLGNPADEELLASVLDVFGSVYVGIDVQASIQQEFAQGQPWTYTPGEGYVGGHAINLQRRYPVTDGDAASLEYWTWGARQRADFSFQAHCAEEAWAVVTQDWVRANGTTIEGLDVEQLLADMNQV